MKKIIIIIIISFKLLTELVNYKNNCLYNNHDY